MGNSGLTAPRFARRCPAAGARYTRRPTPKVPVWTTSRKKQGLTCLFSLGADAAALKPRLDWHGAQFRLAMRLFLGKGARRNTRLARDFRRDSAFSRSSATGGQELRLKAPGTLLSDKTEWSVSRLIEHERGREATCCSSPRCEVPNTQTGTTYSAPSH